MFGCSYLVVGVVGSWVIFVEKEWEEGKRMFVYGVGKEVVNVKIEKKGGLVCWYIV